MLSHLVAQLRSNRRARRALISAASCVGLTMMVLFGTVSAQAATPTQSALVTVSPASQTQPSGAPQTYNISLSCQGTVGSACGPDLTVTIPLDETTTPPMDGGSWVYSATSGTGTLITSGPTVVGSSLVMTLSSSEFIGGYSGSIRLLVTPPNDVTPNNTTWSIAPTLSGDNIAPVTVPTPASSTATARPLVAITKATADGGSVYQVNGTITYNLTVKCNNASVGNLYLNQGSIVDTLPAGLIYVSSTPSGATYDAGTNSVTWPFSEGNTSALPTGCSADGAGTTNYQVVTTAPPSVPVTQPLVNSATFSGTGPDAQNPAGVSSSSTASVPVQIIATPNTGPGPGYATVTKTSLAPIPQAGITSGNQYVATFPGDWVPTSTSPRYAVGAAAASFQTTIRYGLVGTYMTTVIDPVPCLDTVIGGNNYVSNSTSGPVCQNPAFHTTIFNVSSTGYDPSTNGLGQAYAQGWRPVATLTDGSTVSLNATVTPSQTSGSAYFAIPAGDAVATITLPPAPTLMNSTLQLTMWGYTDQSLAQLNGSVNQLTNTATAIPELVADTPLTPVTSSASVFTVPQVPQLGISKSFGTLGAAPGGSTAVNLVGSVNVPAAPLANDVVLTDLLPLGLTWTNPTTTGTFTLTQGSSTSSTPVSVTAQSLTNYLGSGRQLIRVTIPKAAFGTPGSWTIAPPQNFIDVTTPTQLGIYPNTAQIFLFGLAPSVINPVCSTPTQTSGGISPATYQTDNPLDLAGDGNLNESYCQNSASLTVSGTGAAFALTKTVQGNLDQIALGAFGIGHASNGGTGVYGLTWNNVGSDTLGSPVIYDILPYIGDTGVSQGQSSTPRGSEFATIFDGVTLPPDVTVMYSTSTNPCRPEVYPNTANPSCVDDWSSTPPTDLSSVKALRFASSSTYTRGQGFTVNIMVSVPEDIVNKVAWNSAATNASDISDPSAVPLPAEPPKVGLVAPSTPVITTNASSAQATAFGQLSDAVTINGTGGAPGTLHWNLVGPVAPVGDSCANLDWTSAPTTKSGSVPITGDGTTTIGPETLAGIGCYSWSYTLNGTSYPYSASLSPGAANEITTVTSFEPTIVTSASKTVAGTGQQSVSDSIVVGNVPSPAPSPTPYVWTLYGPVAPSADGSCTSVSWDAAPVLATGSVTVTGAGIYPTPSTDLLDPGCYSFGGALPATSDSPEVTLAPGAPSETVLANAPIVTTRTSATSVLPRQTVRDSVTISDTNGGSGTLAWSLVGPVSESHDSCDGVDWAQAPVHAQGSVVVTRDGTVSVGPATVGKPGCYSWAETLTANPPASFPSPVTVPPGAPHEVIRVVSNQPHIATQLTEITSSTGAHSVFDTIALTSTGIAAGPGAPRSSLLTWTLLGPLPPQGGSCIALAWAGAPVAASGTLTVTKDGTYVTPSTQVTSAGCYTFADSLGATTDSDAAASGPGQTLESVSIAAPPIAPTPSSPTAPRGTLAFTGFDGRSLLGGGIVAALVGTILLVSTRRRRRRISP